VPKIESIGIWMHHTAKGLSSPYSPDVDDKGNMISDPRCLIGYLSYMYVLNLKFSWYVSSLNFKPQFITKHINFANVAFFEAYSSISIAK
jgi:hypothetical protein